MGVSGLAYGFRPFRALPARPPPSPPSAEGQYDGLGGMVWVGPPADASARGS